MKKILFLSFVTAAAFGLFSCDAIEDAIDEAQKTVEDYNNDQDPEFKDNGLTVTLSYKQSGLGFYYEAKFKAESDSALFDTVCTSFILKETFALKTAAELAYREMIENNQNNDSANAVIITYDNNKVITSDMSAMHKDLPKDVVVLELKSNEAAYYKAKEAINQNNND